VYRGPLCSHAQCRSALLAHVFRSAPQSRYSVGASPCHALTPLCSHVSVLGVQGSGRQLREHVDGLREQLTQLDEGGEAGRQLHDLRESVKLGAVEKDRLSAAVEMLQGQVQCPRSPPEPPPHQRARGVRLTIRA
jgi:hypothetical protein